MTQNFMVKIVYFWGHELGAENEKWIEIRTEEGERYQGGSLGVIAALEKNTGVEWRCSCEEEYRTCEMTSSEYEKVAEIIGGIMDSEAFYASILQTNENSDE